MRSVLRLGSQPGRALGTRPRRALRRQRGDVRHRDRDHRAAGADSSERAHHARRLPDRPRRQRGGLRHHRDRHRARCAGDDGPGVRRRRSRPRSTRRAIPPTRRRCCWWSSTAVPTRSRRSRARSIDDPAGARRSRGAERLHAGRSRPAVAGTEEGLRRDGADRARSGGAGRGGPPLRPARHHGPDRGDPEPSRALDQQRLPRRGRQSAPQHQLRPARRGSRRTGAAGLPRDHDRLRGRRRQHHRRARRGLGQDRLHAARSSTPIPSRPCARSVWPSIPRSGRIPARSCRSTPAASGGRRRRGR